MGGFGKLFAITTDISAWIYTNQSCQDLLILERLDLLPPLPPRGQILKIALSRRVQVEL